jgi:hypothetical protein
LISKVIIGDDWVARLGPPRPLHFADMDDPDGPEVIASLHWGPP